MMCNKWFTKVFAGAIALLFTCQLAGYAESQRGINSKESIFPGRQLWEFGGRLSFVETNDNLEQLRNSSTDTVLLTPYLRYGLSDDFSLDVDLPFGSADSDALGDDSGLGNIGIGLQLRAYQNALEYPYIIPHIKVNLETADEGSALDDGSGGFEFGVSVGTVVDDRFNWVAEILLQAFVAGDFHSPRIQAKLMQDRGVHVSHIVWVFDGMESNFIRGSVNDSAVQTTTSHPDAKHIRMVIATGGSL